MKFKGVKDIVTTAQKRFTAVNRAREKVSVKKNTHDVINNVSLGKTYSLMPNLTFIFRLELTVTHLFQMQLSY